MIVNDLPWAKTAECNKPAIKFISHGFRPLDMLVMNDLGWLALFLCPRAPLGSPSPTVKMRSWTETGTMVWQRWPWGRLRACYLFPLPNSSSFILHSSSFILHRMKDEGWRMKMKDEGWRMKDEGCKWRMTDSEGEPIRRCVKIRPRKNLGKALARAAFARLDLRCRKTL